MPKLEDIAEDLRRRSEALGEDALDSAPAEVRMQRAPVPIKGYDRDTPVRIYPNDDPRSLLAPREEGYPEDYGLDLRDATRKPTPVARRPKPAAADDEPLPELLANFTRGVGGVADRAQAAMEAPQTPGTGGRMAGFMAGATQSAAMGAGAKPKATEVAQLAAELRKPREVPPEMQELLQAQQRRGQSSDLAGVSDALYSTFSRTPLKPMNQRDPVADIGERNALGKQLDAKALEDPNSEQSRNARAMFASTETGKAFQKEMGPLFDRLPASKIPGAEFLIKAGARKQAVPMDPTKKALMEAQTREADARAAKLGRAGSGAGKPKKLAQIPSSEAAGIGELDAADKTLDELGANWQAEANQALVPDGLAQYFGGTKANRYARETMTGAAQTIGTILEGGKLTDADLPKYMAMLPSAGDSEERATAKIQKLKTMIANKKAAKIAGLNAAGFNTSGFEPAGGAPDPHSAPPGPPDGKIHVSKGTENLYIDPSDLADAEAEGFQQVN